MIEGDLKPRIHIIGGPGSGKTFIAAKLAKHFRIPSHDLDDLFWDGAALTYGVRADSLERDRQLAFIVSQDGWIIEGVYYQWLGPAIDAADVIVALTPSVWVRHWRVIRRFLLRKLGRIPSKRESLADIWRLLCWSHNYDTNQLVQGRKFITERGREVIICSTAEDVFKAVEMFSK